MKLAELIKLFDRFGFTEQHVRSRLGAGDSAHNAFEVLKTELQIRWGVINMEQSPAAVAELQPDYDRIMALNMKSRVTAVDQRKRDKSRRAVTDMFRGAFDQLRTDHHRYNDFFDALRGKK